ncbi:MAG TPA: hypothetical protein VFK02_29485, partial [Kofleriaceae bacterium]|nr:hypothetical protein [Kofleriaceae bacterium]
MMDALCTMNMCAHTSVDLPQRSGCCTRVDCQDPDRGVRRATAGTAGAQGCDVSAQQQHTSLTEHRAIKRLASLVGDVVARLENPSAGDPLGGMLIECNAEL